MPGSRKVPMLYSLEDAKAYSFKNFHVKGLHYVCLSRSEDYTLKYYFYEGEVGDIVSPHDHRYPFRTEVVAGAMYNKTFMRHEAGEFYNAFDFHTPLLGGEGFKWRGTERLIADTPHRLVRGDSLTSPVGSIHTIFTQPGTILKLEQFADEIEDHVPTSTWSKRGETPPNYSDAGIYDKFTADEILHLLDTLTTESGVKFINADDLPH